jgi:FkbM family methyltransferase
MLCRSFRSPIIHAFEPAPEPFARLHARFNATPGVNLINAGVGEQPGRLSFNVYENQVLNSFLPLNAVGNSTFETHAPGHQLTVNVLRLDDYAQQAGISVIDLLKIDTQGYELRILRGAEQLFAAGAVHTVVIEVSFTPLYEGQVWGHELIGQLHAHGFRLVDFYEKCRLSPFLGWCTAIFARPNLMPVG